MSGKVIGITTEENVKQRLIKAVQCYKASMVRPEEN